MLDFEQFECWRQMAGRAAGVARTTLETGLRKSPKALNEARGVVNMPSRAIAAVLLRHEGKPIRHKDLYEKASEYGFLNSRTHFKHVLKMMKGMERIAINCVHPEKIGGSKLSYTVSLTAKGKKVYGDVLGDNVPLPEGFVGEVGEGVMPKMGSMEAETDTRRGLADALKP